MHESRNSGIFYDYGEQQPSREMFMSDILQQNDFAPNVTSCFCFAFSFDPEREGEAVLPDGEAICFTDF